MIEKQVGYIGRAPNNDDFLNSLDNRLIDDIGTKDIDKIIQTLNLFDPTEKNHIQKIDKRINSLIAKDGKLFNDVYNTLQNQDEQNENTRKILSLFHKAITTEHNLLPSEDE